MCWCISTRIVVPKMSLFKSVIELFSEIWKWALIVSRKRLIGDVERARLLRHPIPKKTPDLKIIQMDPTGNFLVIAERIVKDVVEDIAFVRQCESQKQSWLTFRPSVPNDVSIRYYVVKMVHTITGVLPRWTLSKEGVFGITFTLP